ncbi:MAG: 50S ribosomal protein L13 [Eubacteriaceae bacterium]|nr:50S ribosomal protein L13 [Eubacteriaceae bacterium]
MLTRTTMIAKPDQIERKWYVVDAEGQTLGHLAAQVAATLKGKTKPYYTPNIDTGDFVIVINASKIVLTGRKLDQKMYIRHSGYPGGLKTTQYKFLMESKPEFVIEKAVKGMLPKTKLGRKQSKKLFVYAGNEHKHAAQNPEVMYINKGQRKDKNA